MARTKTAAAAAAPPPPSEEQPTAPPLQPPPPPAEYRAALALDLVDPCRYQTRMFDRDQDLEELAASIRAHGVIEPVIVRPQGERYELAAGERRLRASRLAGLEAVPALVRELTDQQLAEVAALENLQRKDLHPLEEAESVRLLLDQPGWGPEAVSAQIGRSPAWVAQRAAIAKLSPAWRSAIANPESDQAGLSAGHLVVVARLPLEQQDELLRDSWFWSNNPTVNDVTRTAESSYLNLSAAPWKQKDADLVPEAGACSTCPKRTGWNPLLFDDPAVVGKRQPDRCMDHGCWSRKQQAFVERRHAELTAAHGQVVRVTHEHGRKASKLAEGALRSWEVHEAKKDAPGAVPCLVVDGHDAGKVTWVAPPKAGGRGESKTTNGPKTLAERRLGLERRRQARAVVDVVEQLGELPPECIPSLDVVARLAAAVGTSYRSEWFHEGEHRETCLDREALAAARKAAAGNGAWGRFDAYGLTAASRTSVRDLWAAVLPVFVSRWKYFSGSDVAKQWYEATRMCELVAIDHQAALAAAVASLPEPKSWAKLAAAEKAAAATARKAKVKTPPKTKRAAAGGREARL